MESADRAPDEVLANLRKIIRAISLRSSFLAHRNGLTSPQIMMLRELSATGEERVGELAKRISASHATVSGIADRLEKRGLVRRTRGSADRRSVWIGLTDSGRAILKDAPPLLGEGFLSEFGRLSDGEQEEILSALRRVASMMAADRPDRSARRKDGVPAEPARPPGASDGGALAR